jgi:hypothetical protein
MNDGRPTPDFGVGPYEDLPENRALMPRKEQKATHL